MSGRDFEESTAELLRAMEYVDVERVGNTADRGVNVIGYHVDRLGYRSKIIIQCKYYDKTPVSSGELQLFVGALATHGAERGIFVTSSYFTREAKEIARINSITIIDGVRFAELCQTYGITTVERKGRPRKVELAKSVTHQDLYDNLSFGSSRREREDLVIPSHSPEVFIEGCVYALVYGSGINLEDVEIVNAVIEVQGFFVINWSVNKVWHDSQGRVRNTWSGDGLFVTNERGQTVFDRGSQRKIVDKSHLANFVNSDLIPQYDDVVSKFYVKFPKIKRVAYKRLIKIQGIRSADIHCDTKKVYVASGIRLDYRYRQKKGSFSLDIEKNDMKHDRHVFTKQEIEKIAVQEHPELETVDLRTEEGKDRWTVSAFTPLKISFDIHKTSGNILTDKTHEEKIIEAASVKAKKIFPDAKYAEDIKFIITLKEDSPASWLLHFSSEKGRIIVRSSVKGDMALRKRINELYALELAQEHNEYDSELDEMKKGDLHYTFVFKGPRCELIILVEFEGEVTVKSFKLTFEEASKRAIQFLKDSGIASPIVVSTSTDKVRQMYGINISSEEEGEFLVKVLHDVGSYSCYIEESSITEHRANYLAKEHSKGEVFSVKKRLFGLMGGWNAVITGHDGERRKILIKKDGEIFER